MSWYLNESFLFKNDSVTEANCTLHAQYVGENNISAAATNANGTDVQIWLWNVTAAAPVLNCTCGDICVNETGWWHDGGAFNASGTPIGHAIDNAIVGDTIFVYNGTYNGHVSVYTAHLTLEGEGADMVTVTATNTYADVFSVRADYVNISGFTTTGATNAIGIYLNGVNHCNLSENNASNNNYGIRLNDSSNNTLVNNTANNNSHNGIYMSSSSSNLIYNNYFNNTNNAYDDGNNIWNTTKIVGTSIIGGPYLGGNCWSDYNGVDTDNDGLGDTSLPYNCSGEIINGGDYLPLVNASVIPVLLVHGFYSSPEMWADMKAFLKNNGHEDEDIFTIDLAPGPAPANGDIKVYAERLSQKIDEIRDPDHDGEYEIDKVDLVCHSMGGLVSRWYTTHGYRNDVRKLIMVGTPNHGSELLYAEHATLLFPKLGIPVEIGIGTAGRQMTPHSQFLNTLNYGAWYHLTGTDLRNTAVQHEVIAGTDNWWFSTWILWGEDDGVVRVESARLDGVNLQTVPYDHLKECHKTEVFKKVLAILQGDSGVSQQSLKSVQTQQTLPTPPQKAPVVFGTIYSGEEKSHKISITSTSEVRFVLAWQEQEGDLNLTLTAPSGRQINASFAANETNTTYYSDEDLTIEGYEIKNPEQGIWSLTVTAVNISGEENYTIMIFLDTNITLTLSLPKYQYDPSEPVSVTANLTYGSEAITDASVTAKIKRPDDTLENITLYDDGLYGDNQTNDGIYANTYTNTSLWGTYDITVTASGELNEEEFEREAFTTVWIEQYPDLTLNATDISFSNETLNVGENVTINATIHNIGEADANNASILFYDGEPANGEKIGENVVNVSVNATANASVSWIANAGIHHIHVLISPYNEFLEENYTNNMANKTIEVNISGDLDHDDEITSTDAAIALNLAVRGEYDITADVSRDGRVTSLDALMILQAAAGVISL